MLGTNTCVPVMAINGQTNTFRLLRQFVKRYPTLNGSLLLPRLKLAAARADNMVFTQGRGFVFGESFGLQRLTASETRFDLPRRGHRLFGNVVSFW